MKIRKFEEKDLHQVLELCREVRQHHIDILSGYFTPQNDNFEKLGFLSSLKDDKIISLVAEDNETICGYLLAEIKYAPYLIDSNVVHVSNFGVKKQLRSQGIGKMLMDTLYDICRQQNIDEIRLGVFNKNIGAYRFYESYGFEPFEQRMNLKVKK